MLKTYKKPSLEEVSLQAGDGVIMTSYGSEGEPTDIVFDDYGNI